MTLFAAGLGWQVNIVHKRTALRHRMEAEGATFRDWDEWQRVKATHPERSISYRADLPAPPAYRWIIGDRAVGAYWLNPDQWDGEEAAVLRKLFPEAEQRGRTRPRPGTPDEFDPRL